MNSQHARRQDKLTPRLRTLAVLGLGAALTAPATSSRAQSPAAANEAASISRGKAIATGKCQACHGLDGQASNPDFPKLAGQLPEFLALQLRNFQSGERPHPVMASLAKTLSAADIVDVSAYYATLPPMQGSGRPPPVSPAVLSLGETLFKAGKAGVPACQHCHGARGQGLAPLFPRLAGQHARFVVASIQPYRVVKEFKNPYAYVMKAVVQNLNDAEITAVAAYIETIR